MGLLTQTTDLKSLRYGNDLYQGGSSRQPFVKFKTPSGEALVEEKFGRENLLGQTGGVDQLTRGSSLLPERIALDVERLGKFLTTSQGLEFLAKQKGLVEGQNKWFYGDDVKTWPSSYNPLSVIANAAGNPVGIHTPFVKFKSNFNAPKDNIPRQSVYNEGNTYSIGTLESPVSAYVARKELQKKDPKVLVDTITYQPLYTGSAVRQSKDLKDTVDFYITKINNDGSGNNTYIHFRSYISGLSDSYKADWGSFKYMGRGENFYYYNGFSRDISFKFVVPVLSKYEQASVYSKLNYLASLMAPDYVTVGGANQGFMRGNLVKLTIGDYITDVPGIIQGVNYTISDETSWDIAKNAEGNKANITDADADTGGYVMPKLIEVSNFSFIPIHTFIPKTVQDQFVVTGDGRYVDAPFISFGKKDGSNTSAGGYGYTNLTPR